MAFLDYTGYAAALCTTGAYMSQVLRVWRTRSTQDISLKMFLVLVTGLTLWLVYEFWKGEIPLIAYRKRRHADACEHHPLLQG